MSSLLGAPSRNSSDPVNPLDPQAEQRDFKVQLVLSILLGASAFLSFCVLRPRWSELYSARKKQSKAASRLPELPETLFGWVPIVYGITRAEILSSAGLDAYAFLAFFRYAIRYLCITLLCSLTIILPVNKYYTDNDICFLCDRNLTQSKVPSYAGVVFGKDDKPKDDDEDVGWLWMYTVFVYFFTGLAFYLLIDETKDMIRIRQAYLGNQSTVTDRTLRLSGIPAEMRSEEKIANFIEDLGIGKVDHVMLCCNWKKLDDMMAQRMSCLRKLERTWAEYLGHGSTMRQARAVRPRPETDLSNTDESQALLSPDGLDNDYLAPRYRQRLQHTLRFGFFGLSSKKVDAIDYYEERLRHFDRAIETLRQQEFTPTALAFVTMESTAACQMAVQAILDPVPGQLLASLAPPSSDVVWSNTYLSRNHRMMRSWAIMIVIGFVTLLVAAMLAPIAGLTSPEALDKVLPGLTDVLADQPLLSSLIRSGLPTLIYSIIAASVPFLFDWLANHQGMISQGDVELSVISKNFFFTFFTLFLVFTVWKTGFTFYSFWEQLRDILKDTTRIAYVMYKSLEKLSPFYINLIILQAFGLLPLRLLEIGTVSLYPFYLIRAKTPRDHAELIKAPIFSYGFYLPQTMLVFVICVVYSVLPQSWLIQLFGLIFFLIGRFVYKFQLLYAMDHQEHSTGRAWPLICNRILLAQIIFHVAMAGFLALQGAFYQAFLIGPCLAATLWFMVYFQRTYFPLMRFIALKSIDDRETSPVMRTPTRTPFTRRIDRDSATEGESPLQQATRYTNPNLVSPLEKLWVRKPNSGHLSEDV